MAIYRAGPVVQAISGNLGSVCFVLGKGSPIVRQRQLPDRSRTLSQKAWQAKYNYIERAWFGLTEDQKLAWLNLARQLNFADALGVSSTRQPLNIFLKYNLLVPDPVTDLVEDAPVAAISDQPSSFTWEPHEGGPYLLYYIWPGFAAGGFITAYGARTFSPRPRNWFGNYRIVFQTSWDGSPFDLQDTWDPVLGELKEGEVTQVRVRPWLPTKLPAPDQVVTSTVLGKGLFPQAAYWNPGTQTFGLTFDEPLKNQAGHTADFVLGDGSDIWNPGSIVCQATSCVGLSCTKGSPWSATGITYYNNHDDIQSADGLRICPDFAVFPYTLI